MTGQVVLVASAGGHIDQAFEIAGRFAARSQRSWIAARTPQTESLLADERVDWVPDIRSRQAGQAARAIPGAMRIMRRVRPSRVVSTGSALAVPYILAARATGVPVTYVESATRLLGPSVTGRIAERIPGVQLYCQGKDWDRRRWTFFGSIFDRYEAHPDTPRTVTTALVTIGSEQFPFARGLEAAKDALDGVATSWQTGNTPADGLGLEGEVRAWWPGSELATKAREADVVLTHAGVGSILMVLRTGRCPVVIPRLHSLGEHIDDHQLQLSNTLAERDLVVVAEPGADVGPCIEEASSRRILTSDGR